MSNLPSRRQALFGATLSFSALWTTLSLPSVAMAQTTLSWSPKVLTQAQAQVLEVAVDLIIPATDTPGAREAGVARFIDRAMGNFYDPGQVKTMRDRSLSGGRNHDTRRETDRIAKSLLHRFPK